MLQGLISHEASFFNSNLIMINTFLPQKGNYRDLIVFQKSTCIYDITHYFARTFLSLGDRTVDQMIQVARSGRQNIAEGSAASTTSKETEIKLTNVAKASLQELLLDYEDYLWQNGLEQWTMTDPRTLKARGVCKRHNDTEFYMAQIPSRSAETIANIAIILIHQADTLLRLLIERLKKDFLENGGIREEMTRGRIAYRQQHGSNGGRQ